MADYRIEIGTMRFEAPEIVLSSINVATAVDIVGAELSADEFTAILCFEAGVAYLFSPADYDGVLTADNYLFGTADVTSGDLTTVPYGTPLDFYDGADLVARFFIRSVQRIGRQRYQINAMSAVGMLEYVQHLGGVYNDTTVAEIITEIVGGAFPFQVAQDAAGQKVAGWLPIDSARNNLHRVLFAMGIAVTKDSTTGEMVFQFLDSSTPSAISDDAIYIGGRVDYNALVTAVEVTEHAFYRAPAEPEQIFSNINGVAAVGLFVPFSAPYWDVQAEGLTVSELGDNYAVVTGVGTLTGRPYVHTQQIRRREISGTPGVVPNVVTSSDDAMVNSLNALNVLDRLAAYYGSRKTISADIVRSGERAGDSVAFTDAFGDAETGIIEQMSLRVSGLIRASCRIVTDYSPTGQGNTYTNRLLIDASGSWTVPTDVTRIRIALIGGGGGGYGGNDGEEGAGGIYDPDFSEYGDLHPYRDRDEGYLGYHYVEGEQPVKHGGAGGQPGTPGRVYAADLEVTPGETISFVVGVGGAGGADADEAGQNGTETTATSTSFGEISSDDGFSSAAGFFDAAGGVAFATAGSVGYAGCDGGQTDTESLLGWLGGSGLPGADFDEESQGGQGGAGAVESSGNYRASGGGGGGAAYGADGGAGGSGRIENTNQVYGGDGGDGADALPPPQAFFGCAGDGGNGGGAGGNAGAGYNWRYFKDTGAYYKNGEKGQPGLGSAGGQGGPGCAIIYW